MTNLIIVYPLIPLMFIAFIIYLDIKQRIYTDKEEQNKCREEQKKRREEIERLRSEIKSELGIIDKKEEKQ